MARIVQILSIEDTRSYVEQGDRWVPVPGSGEARECDRCGRLHEVHATVLLDDASTIVVGTGCAARESADLAPRFKRADAIIKRLTGFRAHAADLQAKADAYDAAKAAVSRLTKPAPTYEYETDSYGDERCIVRVGDAWSCYTVAQGLDADRYNAYHKKSASEHAAFCWEENRLKDRGITYAHERARRDLEALQTKIRKNEKALSDLLTA